MKEIISFDNWTIDVNAPYGSGRSQKHWLVHESGKKGIFKYPKIKRDGRPTGEFWAEALAYDIAVLLEIPCAKVDMGYFNGKLGSMSYMLLEENEYLAEGISFISKEYFDYDKDMFYDKSKSSWYSIQMILDSIRDLGLDMEFLKIPIFDCLIGNSDRHHSNWAIVINKDTDQKKISPLYDNGSSLCSIVNEDKISLRDRTWFHALIHTKSLSMIRFENVEKRPTHFEMIRFIADNFYKETIDLVRVIEKVLTEDKIEAIVNNYSDELISPRLKKVVKLFLYERRSNIIKSFFKDGK